jgi:hypothetical protein
MRVQSSAMSVPKTAAHVSSSPISEPVHQVQVVLRIPLRLLPPSSYIFPVFSTHGALKTTIIDPRMHRWAFN